MLQQLLGAQQIAFNEASVGRELGVLFERDGKRVGQLVGRTPFMQAVHVTVPQGARDRLLGRILPVRIERAHPNSLAGRLVAEQAASETPADDSAAADLEEAAGNANLRMTA